MRPRWMAAGGSATLGLEMVLSVVFGVAGGRWLDGQFATTPYLTGLGLVLGIAAGVRFLVRATRRMQRETERDGFEKNLTDRPAKFALEQRGGR